MYEAGSDSRRHEVALVRDDQACIPLTNILESGDVVLLLTPVVVPGDLGPQPQSDPFESFGRALASRHPWIRHAPYTPRGGITSTHVGLIKRARIVIFVITGPPSSGQSSQAAMAQAASDIGETRPQIIIACHQVQHLGLDEYHFATVLQLSGYQPADLQAAAEFMFGEVTVGAAAPPDPIADTTLIRRSWAPEAWDSNRNDIVPVHNLWTQCLPAKFHLSPFSLRSLLQRDGYAMHYVVKAPGNNELLGFCATYTTFVDQEGIRLTGSMAMVLVKAPFRGQGIGLSLYNHAIKRLKRTRGVHRIQLGSNFPRLLYGLPVDFTSAEWFKKRGWEMDGRSLGRGQEASDLLINITDWPSGAVVTESLGLTFRRAAHDELPQICGFVERESLNADNVGWCDQYLNLGGDGRVDDIVLGLDNLNIVATAIIYTPTIESSISRDLPWARSLGFDVGGIACICITNATNSKDAIMIRLLNACVAYLEQQGMARVFLDGIKGGHDGFSALGFQKWATYRDLWKLV